MIFMILMILNFLFILVVWPISGLFEVMGMIDETVFRKMVSDSRIVTPENKNSSSKKIHGGIAI